ncbi:MAG: purine-nucleoside/S-methyl-5-thioadenosine phosphorylase / adenosine deaminase [Halanaerobiales bacterium]|nr:purine-nucleoside/S-methyl-5-thioadenosine phosphorylase / adenosine deaminase [Halanaerobiales bacterium]
MFVWREDGKGLKYFEIEEFVSFGIKALFTSRLGGVSKGDYTGLNLGLHTGDNPESVLTNRRLIAEAAGFDYRDFVAGEQVHGCDLYLVDEADKGRGALAYNDSIPGIDGLITAARGVPLISFYADCVPLFVMEPSKGVVALAHAGWKGTVKKIAQKTIIRMKEIYGVRTKDCWAAIGPSISRDHYEVDQPVIDHFKMAFSYWRELVVDRGKGYYLLDLKLANMLLFKEAGLPEEQIIVSEFCTFKDQQYFYSYRREMGKTGRMASIICR